MMEYSVEDSRMLPMKSSACSALLTIRLSKSFVVISSFPSFANAKPHRGVRRGHRHMVSSAVQRAWMMSLPMERHSGLDGSLAQADWKGGTVGSRISF